MSKSVLDQVLSDADVQNHCGDDVIHACSAELAKLREKSELFDFIKEKGTYELRLMKEDAQLGRLLFWMYSHDWLLSTRDGIITGTLEDVRRIAREEGWEE